jgi:isoleucyl-tRNA synthetase
MFETQTRMKLFLRGKRGYLELWKLQDTVKKVLLREKMLHCLLFTDGPPFATGLPHYGHILAGTMKDVVPRYKTMKGFDVPRRFGWDCHGLPVENEMRKARQLAPVLLLSNLSVSLNLMKSVAQSFKDTLKNGKVRQ